MIFTNSLQSFKWILTACYVSGNVLGDEHQACFLLSWSLQPGGKDRHISRNMQANVKWHVQIYTGPGKCKNEGDLINFPEEVVLKKGHE